MLRLRTNKRSLNGLLGGLAIGLLVLACDGQNLFVGPSLTQQEDRAVPTVTIQVPGESAAAPLDDSVLVTVHATDDSGLSSLQFEGISFRGDVNLGTNELVPRFETKLVQLLDPTQDTIISRWLIPIPDTLREETNIIVTAFDTLGNVSADTVPLILGGPEVNLEDLVDQVPAGANMPITVRVSDPLGVRLIEAFVTGAIEVTFSEPVSPVDTVAVLEALVSIPPGTTGTITVSARAVNTLNVPGNDGPFEVEIITGGGGDTTPPGVQLTAVSADRMELRDQVTVEVKARDDVLGVGVTQMGYTALAISPTRGTTLIQTESVTFATPRVGNVTQTFEFPVFNADPLALPDTLIFEVTAFVRDQQGNCSTSVGADSLVALACGSLSGATVAQAIPGDRSTVVVVAGRTVQLPAGGLIMDAIVDTIRRKLYLSNIEGDRLEVFRLGDETFEPAALVGSEPWGLALQNDENFLLVANSGGTNISVVDLGSRDGSEVPTPLPDQRILTPDVVLFEVEQTLSDNGFTTNVIHIPDVDPPGFSDRPQFIAVDATDRILYSTKTTLLGDLGTIRKSFIPPGQTDREVILFHEHSLMLEAEDVWGLANVDFAADRGGDQVRLFDHVPGDRGTAIDDTDVWFDPVLATFPVYSSVVASGSDADLREGRWNLETLGFHDTTFVTASGNGAWVVFGEGATAPVGRIIMYDAFLDDISTVISVEDLMINSSETVRGIGLNQDGTLGVVRGSLAYFFTTDLRLQGVAPLPPGGAGAALHPLHANARSLDNAGEYRPNTHLAFLGTGERTIDILDTFHFFRSGRIFIKDVISGPLRAVLPFSGVDNVGLTCATVSVTGVAGMGGLEDIGDAIDIFSPATDDACVVVKLFGITDSGGIVVVDVRKSDIIRDRP